MPASTSTTAQNLSTRQTKFVHPTFQVLSPEWQKLRDVREGTGGFLNGDYLVGHPREYITTITKSVVNGVEVKETVVTKRPTKKFKARKDLASYENFAATIIEALKTALCREQPTRRLGDGKATAKSAIEEWWDDVDGIGTHIDDFMEMAWDIAGTFGHVHLYMDREPMETPASGAPPTAADQRMPFLRLYTPLDAWDWIIDDVGRMTSIKFAELAPREDIETPWRPEVRIRIVNETEWKLYGQDGKRVDSGAHQFGKLPVVTLFAQRKPLEPSVGQSVLGDPKLYIDLYNLGSEVRELLRNQTFGILNVPLGTGDSAMTLTEAQAMMGNAVGTENVLFSGVAADYISPAADNVVVYHQEMTRKLRTIYRLASLSWEADSKDAEAEGSLKLKREDMNQRLAGYADELEKADYALACLFYRATEGADTGEQKLEKDELLIKYPEDFDMTPFDKIIEQAQAASDLGMPTEMLKAMRKMLVRKFEGFADMPESELKAIDDAIDAATPDLTPAEQAAQRVELTQQALKAGAKPKIPPAAAA